MTDTITLTHPSINSGSPVTVLATSLTVSGKKNLKKDPYTNGSSQAEVQTLPAENITYVLNGVKFTGASGTFTYAHLLTLYRHKYGGPSATGANAPCVLSVTYNSGTSLVGHDGSTTSINVVLDGFSVPIDYKDTKHGTPWNVTVTLVGTA